MKRYQASITRRVNPEALTIGPAGFFPEELRHLLDIIRDAGHNGITSRPLRDACRSMRRALEDNNPLPSELARAGVTVEKVANGLRYYAPTF